ncbi:MAG: DNA polymerase III subunit delta [Endomicrobiales bacterium]|nr:DNA polymerase III subunit delta [Endomicrobiales bacterium]
MANIKYAEALSQWKNGKFRDLYLLAGEEIYLIEEAVRALSDNLKIDSLNTETFSFPEADLNDVMLAAQTMPFLAGRRLVIVKNVNRLKSADLNKFVEFLKFPTESVCLVLVWPERVRKDDRKHSLFRAAGESGDVMEFRALYDSELPGWIIGQVRSRGKKISAGAIKYLANESGSNLLDLENEIEKLVLFCGKRQEIGVDDVEALSGHTKQANLNGLADAVESSDCRSALKISEKLLSEGEIPLRLIATIHRTVKRLAVAKSLAEERGMSQQEIRQELNLNPYFDRNFFARLSKHTMRGLEKGLEDVLEADLELKSSSLPEEMVFERLIISLCGYSA